MVAIVCVFSSMVSRGIFSIRFEECATEPRETAHHALQARDVAFNIFCAVLTGASWEHT